MPAVLGLLLDSLSAVFDGLAVAEAAAVELGAALDDFFADDEDSAGIWY